jgi:hypothetical protein
MKTPSGNSAAPFLEKASLEHFWNVRYEANDPRTPPDEGPPVEWGVIHLHPFLEAWSSQFI